MKPIFAMLNEATCRIPFLFGFVGGSGKYVIAMQNSVTIQDRLIDVLWAVITTIIVATVSFFITKFWRKITNKKKKDKLSRGVNPYRPGHLSQS